MRAVLDYLRYRTPAWLVLTLALALVAADIGRVTGWPDVSALLRSVFRSTGPGREIRNYVEFVKVPAGSFVVVTGIQYHSSLDGLVDHQWCYVAPAADGDGAAEHKLTLGNAQGTEPPVPNRFTADNLGAFGLTADAALVLMKTHCRFKAGGKSAHV